MLVVGSTAACSAIRKGKLPQLHEVVFEYEMFNGRRIKKRVNQPIRLDSPRLVRVFSGCSELLRRLL